MNRLIPALSLAVGLLCASATARALEVKTFFGSFNAPEGVAMVSRDEKVDPKTGKPFVLTVFSRAKDPKAVFVVVANYAAPDPAKPYDPLDGAVKIGNPFDKKLTRDAATPVLVGGVEGGRYEGQLPDGVRAVSYVAVKDGYRIVVLLKSPPESPYKELTDAFAKSVEGFSWALPMDAAASAAR